MCAPDFLCTCLWIYLDHYLYACVFAHVHVYVYVCMRVCVCASTRMCTRAHVCMRVRACVRACMHACLHACRCRARQTRVRAYARTHKSEKRGDTYGFFKLEIRRRTQHLMRPRTPCFTNRVERNESLIILASTPTIAHTKFTIVITYALS